MYNEIFLNTKSSVFDRNRVYGGLGYKFSKILRLELGYMYKFFETSGRYQINNRICKFLIKLEFKMVNFFKFKLS
jgi:hypothetical protein